MKKKSTLWIIQCGFGIALVLLAQFIGKLLVPYGNIGVIPLNQLVTGTLVNAMLLTMCIKVDWFCGVVVGVFSAILAQFMGMGPLFPIMTPIIALANAIIVIAFYMVYKFCKNRWVSVIVAGSIKCGFLWISMPLLLDSITNIKPPQAKMLTLMFSWPQAVTAIVGGLLMCLLYPYLKEVKSK